MKALIDDLGVTPDIDRYDEAISKLRRKIPLSDDEWDELEAAERTRAFRVATVSQADLADGLLTLLERSIEKGLTLDDFRSAAGDMLADSWEGEDSPELETVFRTNVMSAYNGGRYDLLDRPEVRESHPYRRYELIDDDRLCEICEPCGGVILPADDPWWDEHIPPLHMRCRCTFSPMAEEDARAEGVDDKGPRVDVQDGFGAPPAPDDWEPDPSRFSPDVRAIVERRLRAED